MKVDGRVIGNYVEPYIIAELSANHGGVLERAKDSIVEAAKTGVAAIKLQTYTADTMTINCDRPDFLISDGIWSGRKLYDLYEEAYTPFAWHKELFDLAKSIGVTIFSTPFDESAVDLLEDLETPAYKVASFELIDIPLLKYIAKKQKPIFMSTGMASKAEVTEAVEAIREETEADILLFHCVSSYPAPTHQSNLNNLLWLKNNFNVEVGLSDHTTSNVAALTAIGMGAVAIEKHFKLDDKISGPDSSFSLSIDKLAQLTVECKQAWLAKGVNNFARSPVENSSILFRRSIYFVKNLQDGQIIKEADIRRIRPGYGISPKYFNSLVGRRVNRSVERGEPVAWSILTEE